MNFTTELNKPIFVARPTMLRSFNSATLINEALASEGAIYAANSGDYIIKASTARRLQKSTFVSVDESTISEIKDLVVARLEADREEKFQFLDGRMFTGPEAAKEVTAGTKVGTYFLEVEKETLRIVQEAFLRGELK